MPHHDKMPEQIEAETDKLLLEQALAFVRDLRAAAQNAPYGKMIRHAEVLAVQQGREFIRIALETIVQEQNDILENRYTVGVRDLVVFAAADSAFEKAYQVLTEKLRPQVYEFGFLR